MVKSNPALVIVGANPPKAPAEMRGGEIHAELDKLAKASSKITAEFIAAGRGYEKPSETWQKDDPLAERYKAVSSRHAALVREIENRAGPGSYRLPRGVGRSPRVKSNPHHGERMSGDVVAILYRHVEDDPESVRVHFFGGSGDFRELPNGAVKLTDLPDDTGVEMFASGDRLTITLQHADGLPLAEEFA